VPQVSVFSQCPNAVVSPLDTFNHRVNIYNSFGGIAYISMKSENNLPVKTGYDLQNGGVL
jgi:hypothetical protein